MRTRPVDLSDAQLADAVASGWGLTVDATAYVPVGFGSHHWWVGSGDGRWFVTLDDLATKKRHPAEQLTEPRRRLAAALWTARSLRDAGCDFVVAPRLTTTGDVLSGIDGRFVAALYPRIDGETYGWGPYRSRTDRLAALELIAAVHTALPAAPLTTLVDDFVIPDRQGLQNALAAGSSGWDSGPFGEPTRILLQRHRTAVVQLLERYDRLAYAVAPGLGRMVVTHGEPHQGNTIGTTDGMVLVDWDTALLAPPERDLWALAAEDPEILGDYTARTGITIDDDALELYRLRWDLADIATFVAEFREPHTETADTALAWEALTQCVDPTRWSAGSG